MAFIRDGKHRVDVARHDCKSRECYQLGFDKGTYVPGQGYTSYYKKPYPVCWTRHLHGCPVNSICPECHTVTIDPPGSKCTWCNCDGTTRWVQ